MEHKTIKFPLEGKSGETIKNRIKPERKSPRRKGGFFLGYPHTTPLSIAIDAYKNYLVYNTNHVGTVTRLEQELTSSRQLENETIRMLGDLYGDSSVDGYVNSGSTEGNIFGVWIGKNCLCKGDPDRLALLTSEIAHHSVDKAASIHSIKKVVKIPVDHHYGIDVIKLREIIIDLCNAGIKNYILVLTSGYTCTGTRDSIEEVEKVIYALKSEYDFRIYVHIDAAIGGLVFPFVSSYGRYFSYECVKSITVDPHKMGFTPLSAGIFLCRKGLQSFIETSINYVQGKNDDTLIGSRNGASAVAIWAVINHLGFDGFEAIIRNLMSLKNNFIVSLEKNKDVMIVSNSEMNMVCLSFQELPDGRLPRFMEEKYTMDQFQLMYHGQSLNCYKIYFMPHLTSRVIKSFIHDINKIYKGK